MATIADPTIIIAFGTILPKTIFYYFIIKQEQHKHNLDAIRVKLHIRDILDRATVKKLLKKQFMGARVVITSQQHVNKVKHGIRAHFINLCEKLSKFHVQSVTIRAIVKKI